MTPSLAQMLMGHILGVCEMPFVLAASQGLTEQALVEQALVEQALVEQALVELAAGFEQ